MMFKFFSFVFLFFHYLSFSQIIGNCNAPYNNADGLVNILVGEGVEFSNAVFSGFDCSAGLFNGTSNIGFESGLVMATDGLESIGPGVGGGFGTIAGVDADLTLQLEMVGATATNVNNLIVIEFDFIPTSDVVTFEYVFASNEYPGYTCSQFNDIFGFFLSGPGIIGGFSNNAINIALVPDPNNLDEYTDTPVIINTINSGISSSGDSSPCDNIDPNWTDYSIFFTDNSAATTVSYPGFTVPLIATANVTACETYHIKLAVADCADGALNSAVFLQENSFNSPPPIEYIIESNLVSVLNPNSTYIDNLYEGCGSASIIFERPEGIDGDIVFDYQVTGSAIQNTDYIITNAGFNQITMLNGQPNISLDVLTIEDLTDEPVEEIIIEILPVDYGCYESNPDTIEFELFDQPELFLSVSQDVLLDCPGDEALLNSLATGGVGGLMEAPFSVPPYLYQWIELSQGPNLVASPDIPSNYCIQATDVCGQIVSDCIFVDVETYEDLIISSDIVYTCYNEIEELCLNTEGGNSPFSFLWSNGSNETCIEDLPGIYSILVIDECGIEQISSAEIYLDAAPEVIFDVYQMPDENFGVQINNFTEPLDDLSYLWDFGDGIETELSDPETHFYQESGEYSITLSVTTEINNCYNEFSQVVQLAPLYYFYAANSFTPNNDLINDTFGPSVVGFETFEMYIFDRWGKQVFYTDDIANMWRGTYNSIELQMDSYAYLINIKKYFDDTIYQESGPVTIIR